MSILLNCHRDDYFDRCGPLVTAGLRVEQLEDEESLKHLNALALLAR